MHSIQIRYPSLDATTPPLQEHEWETNQPKIMGILPIDRSQPRPVEFAWERPAIEGDSLRYELQIAKDPEFSNPYRIKDLKGTSARVPNLEIGTRYYWKVTATRQNQELATSPVSVFSTHPQAPRWLSVPGITNVRDVGGWATSSGKKIRQGMVYRSSEMNSHLELTDQGRDILLHQLGVRTDMDLRGEEELCEPALPGTRYINIPLQPYIHISEARYQPLYRQVFQVLADPSTYPVIVHCWGGADRTGTVVFLLQALLGVELESLIQDYELTSLSIWGERRHTSDEFSAFLQYLSGLGGTIQASVEQYLLSVGISTAEMSSIRKVLVSDS
jgi:rhodanese-related sulfurtransferase